MMTRSRLLRLAAWSLLALMFAPGCGNSGRGGNSDEDTGPGGERYGPGRHDGSTLGPERPEAVPSKSADGTRDEDRRGP